MESPSTHSWKSYIKPNPSHPNASKTLEGLLSDIPDLEYLIEQVPNQTADQIFDAVERWNKSQRIAASGMYLEYPFNFNGTDGQLKEFKIQVFGNGRITISVLRN